MKRLPLSVQILYGVGVSYAIVDQIFAQWLLYFYLPPSSSSLEPLLPPILISVALLIARFLDTILEPVVGFLSDRFSSRWGRRIPFMFLGSLPLSLSTIAFFYPVTSGGDLSTFFYLATVGSLFFVFYTFVSGPYCALVPEIASSREDQLNLSMWQSIFRLIYTALAMILPGILIELFGQGDDLVGIRMMIILLSAISFLGVIVCSLSINERKYSGGKTFEMTFRQSFGIIMKDRNYLIYLFGFLFFFLGFNTLRASMNYIVEDVMGYSTAYITVASGLLFGSAALSFVPINKACRKIGYKKPTLVFLGVLIVLTLMLFQVGKTLPNWFGFVLFVLMGPPVAGTAFIFPSAMVSEISAVYSITKKLNIEGMLFGFQGIFLKFSFLISIAILPLLLVWGSELSFLESMMVTPEGVALRGVYSTTIFASISFFISFLIYWFYQDAR